MPLDYARLGQAIRAASKAKDWLQEDLITHSGISRSTIQRLWKGEAAVRPSRRTQSDLEDCLGWTRGSVMAILNGGDPTRAAVAPEPDVKGYLAQFPTTDETQTFVALIKDLAELTPDELEEVTKYAEYVKGRIASRK